MSQSTSRQEEALAEPGGRWRGVLFLLPITVWSLLGAGLIGLGAAFSKSFRERGYVRWIRIWGRVPLILVGVKLEVHGREHVQETAPRL